MAFQFVSVPLGNGKVDNPMATDSSRFIEIMHTMRRPWEVEIIALVRKIFIIVMRQAPKDREPAMIENME